MHSEKINYVLSYSCIHYYLIIIYLFRWIEIQKVSIYFKYMGSWQI